MCIILCIIYYASCLRLYNSEVEGNYAQKIILHIARACNLLALCSCTWQVARLVLLLSVKHT